MVLGLVSTGCANVTPLQPSAASVDVLDYLVGDPALWPRHGDQEQHQVIDWERQTVCWVKYSRPAMYECWRWDDSYIYHAIDAALDGDTGESYRFTDARWLPRRLSGRWSLDVEQNRIQWFDRGCEPVRGPQGMTVDAGLPVFPYRVTAWLEPASDAGDLGVRDVLVLVYAPHAPGEAPRGEPERFTFARGAGWMAWQRGAAVRRFDRVGGLLVLPAFRC